MKSVNAELKHVFAMQHFGDTDRGTFKEDVK